MKTKGKEIQSWYSKRCKVCRAVLVDVLPFVAGQKIKIPWEYISNNWTDIVATEKGKGIYAVKAKNIETGTTIKFPEGSLLKLPADLRYNIMSQDITISVSDDYVPMNKTLNEMYSENEEQ